MREFPSQFSYHYMAFIEPHTSHTRSRCSVAPLTQRKSKSDGFWQIEQTFQNRAVDKVNRGRRLIVFESRVDMGLHYPGTIVQRI